MSASAAASLPEDALDAAAPKLGSNDRVAGGRDDDEEKTGEEASSFSGVAAAERSPSEGAAAPVFAGVVLKDTSRGVGAAGRRLLEKIWKVASSATYEKKLMVAKVLRSYDHIAIERNSVRHTHSTCNQTSTCQQRASILTVIAHDRAEVIQLKAAQAAEKKPPGVLILDNDRHHQMHHALLACDYLGYLHQVAPEPFALNLWLHLYIHDIERGPTALDADRLTL